MRKEAPADAFECRYERKKKRYYKVGKRQKRYIGRKMNRSENTEQKRDERRDGCKRTACVVVNLIHRQWRNRIFILLAVFVLTVFSCEGERLNIASYPAVASVEV